MGLPRGLTFVTLICLLVLTSAGIAETETETVKVELEKLIGKLRENLENKASLDELSFPEDTSQRFLVKEIQISGNNLVSTSELLEKMPLTYSLFEERDGNTVGETYDFRTLLIILVSPGQEREVSLKTIQGLTKYVLSIYQEKGYAGIYVYVPAKAVEGEAKLVDKILPIEVIEGKVAKVAIERYDFDRQEQEEGILKDSVIYSWSPAQVGEVIKKKDVDNFANLLNLNPDRYISAVISRSTEPNALNLTYDVYESNPWHWYLQSDNAGTDDRQWSPRLGIINTNLTGIDDRFSVMYQAPWEKGIEDEYALFGSYNLPVFTPRLRLNLYAGYSQFDTPGLTGIDFIGNGSFYGGILSYNIFQKDDWFFDITGSFSHERSKVTPSLGIATDVDMDLFGAGVHLHRSEDLSDTSVSFNTFTNVSGTDDEVDIMLRQDDADFTIYNLSTSHSMYLDTKKVNRLSGTFRLITSDERLVPAKMTTFGGLYSVRGYEEDEIVADGGIIMSAQYEFDLVKHNEAQQERVTGSEQSKEEKPCLTKLAPLVFIDYGRAKIKSPVVGEEEIQELGSIGAGVVIEIGDNFNAGIYYGWPLRATEETDKGDGRFNFSLRYRY
ncbi:MAG: ShlB/FhaC/HecB family hemolysin secretion/activation protein [Planctomycetota bacterium]|jgi:hemolysin activation/secretion protein